MNLMQYKQYLPFAAFFAALSVFFFLPVLNDFGNWGLYDWDQHLFYHASPRIAILDYGQFPLWNAHYCGGTPLLANPQSAFLSPFFAFVLLFGAVWGLKLEAMIYLFFGLFGTFLVARKLGSAPVASAVAAVVFMLSSWYAVRVVVGHTTFFPFALMPWLFLFYLKSLQSVRWVAAAAFTLAITFLAGGIYPFYASVLLLGGYSLLASVEKRRLSPLIVVAAVLVLAFLLAAVKALPVLEFTAGASVERDVQMAGAKIFARALFYPFQDLAGGDFATGLNTIPEGVERDIATSAGEVPWGWHEYSAYVGVIAFLLAAISVFNYRKSWKLLALALFFFALSLGDSSPVPLWKLLRSLPFLGGLHGPSRFIIPLVFVTSLLAANSVSKVRLLRLRRVSLILLAVITAELLLVSMPLVSQAFPVKPPENLQTGNPGFIQFYSPDPYVSQYPDLLQNLGTLNCYERVHLRIRASPQFVGEAPYPNFIGNAYVAETNQSLDFSYFSPNKVKVNVAEAEINETATLVVNQNYHEGWKASILTDVRSLPSLRSASNGKVKSHNGLLAAEITPDDRYVEFRYLPESFVIGAMISAAALLLSLLIFFKPKAVKRILFQEQS